MLVEWTLWCTAAKSGPACSTLFSMCLLFHECTWALKLPLASKSHVSLHVYVHLWEGESEGGRRSNSKGWGQNRFDHAGVSLMSCTSSQNIWGTITGVARREKQAPEEALFYCSSIFCGVFFFFFYLKITDCWSSADNVEYTTVGTARPWQASEELQKKWATRVHTGR